MLHRDKETDTQEMLADGVIQCTALAAMRRREAGTVREGRERVYMSARLNFTCANSVRQLRNSHVCMSAFLYLYKIQGCESLWFVVFVGACANSSLPLSTGMYCNPLCARKANTILDLTYTSPQAVTNNFCVSGRSEHEQTVSAR